MNNIKPLLKRVCAYAIDLVLILVVSSLISSLPIFNKEANEYQKAYSEYEKIYYEYADYLKLLEESFKDEKIEEEEYSKLSEVSKFQELISSKYEDNKISKKEYTKIVSTINEEFDKIAKDYVYILGTKSISNSVVTLVCTLLYFGVIQYFLKGQTIGKKLLKLKVVSSKNKKLNIFNYLLRSLIVNEVLLNGIGILFIALASKSVYTQADTIIKTTISIVEGIIIFLVLTREDQRGLHDLLFGTKVISTEEPKIEIEETKVIDVITEETKDKEENKKQSEKSTAGNKKTSTNKKTSKSKKGI